MIKQGLDDYLIVNGRNAFANLMDNVKFDETLIGLQQELTGNLAKRVPFPIDIFPMDISNLLKELHLRHDAPLEYIGSLFIAFASVLMLGRYIIIVDKKKNWEDDPIMWLAVVGDPSQKKTPILNIFKKIIDDYDRALNQKYEEDIKKYKLKMQEYKKALKKFETSKSEEIPIEPEEPLKQRLTTQNITVEALLKAIAKNEKGIKRAISIVVDELATLLKGMGQYKNGGNDAEMFLQFWKRTLSNIIRTGNDLDYTVTAFHTIIGTIQPKTLDKTLFANGIDTENGMIERWLFATSHYKETGKEYDGDNEYDISPIRDIYDKLYQTNQEEIRKYYFSPVAQAEFNKFTHTITQRKNSDKISDLMKNYLQKQTDYVARFSLILHCINDPKPHEIQTQTVKNAVKLSYYFIACFEDITLQRFNSIPLSEKALNYIRSKGLKTISPTKLYKSNTSAYKSTTIADIMLEHLANRGYGRFVKHSNGSVTFKIYS